MMFVKDEKVFSLAGSAAAVPRGDITLLFEEFYCYLLVAGLFREGESIHGTYVNISSQYFTIPAGSYNSGLAKLISKGLKDRYDLITRHPQLTDNERRVLTALDAIFTNDRKWFVHLTGKDLISIAYGRQFREEMKTIAHYVAVAFGQSDYPPSVSVPRLYLSVFGNIHLAKPEHTVTEDFPSLDRVTLEAPVLCYGSDGSRGNIVTALWSILSAQISSLSQVNYYQNGPGDYLGDVLESFKFLTENNGSEQAVSLPVYAASLYIQRVMGIDDFNPVTPSVIFYRDFLYNSHDEVTISRQPLLNIIINLMMEKMGETNLDHLFSARSFYRKLTISTLHNKSVKRPQSFQFALEALEPETTKEINDKDTNSSLPLDDQPSVDDDDEEQDLQTDEGGYDPSTPPPVSPVTSDVDKDTIDLISFNKTGEGVNEDFYRQAVVILNDRLRNDDTLPVTAETKDALNYWVNGLLYRTTIQATKDYLQTLHLQQHLKILSTKG